MRMTVLRNAVGSEAHSNLAERCSQPGPRSDLITYTLNNTNGGKDEKDFREPPYTTYPNETASTVHGQENVLAANQNNMRSHRARVAQQKHTHKETKHGKEKKRTFGAREKRGRATGREIKLTCNVNTPVDKLLGVASHVLRPIPTPTSLCLSDAKVALFTLFLT